MSARHVRKLVLVHLRLPTDIRFIHEERANFGIALDSACLGGENWTSRGTGPESAHSFAGSARFFAAKRE